MIRPLRGFGAAGSTANARVRIPAVQGQSYFMRVTGIDPTVVNGYNVTVVDMAPATPTNIELADQPVNGTTSPPGQNIDSDTGRSQTDNVTYDSTPTLIFRLDDATLLKDIQGNQTPGLNNAPPGWRDSDSFPHLLDRRNATLPHWLRDCDLRRRGDKSRFGRNALADPDRLCHESWKTDCIQVHSDCSP